MFEVLKYEIFVDSVIVIQEYRVIIQLAVVFLLTSIVTTMALSGSCVACDVRECCEVV